MKLEYSRIERNGKKPPEPFSASEGAAGPDLTAFGAAVDVPAAGHAIAKTGICVAIPKEHVGLIFVRSSLGVKRGIMLSNNVGVIDSDYRGELLVSLYNTNKQPVVLKNGERIAQLVVVPCPHPEPAEVDTLSETSRGEGRFGSTGK